MAEPFRRLFARYPCDIPVDIRSLYNEARIAEGRIVNMSLGGARLDCSRPLERKVTYLFRVNWKKTNVDLSGQVVWTAPRNPLNPGFHQYGVQFNLTSNQESQLRALVERLRQLAEPPAGRDIMRDYWKR